MIPGRIIENSLKLLEPKILVFLEIYHVHGMRFDLHWFLSDIGGEANRTTLMRFRYVVRP